MAMTDGEYRCSECKVRYKRDKKKQHRHQERKGCFAEFPSPLLRYRGDEGSPMHKSDKINYFKCPAQLYSSYWAYIINLEHDFREGIMPYSGNLLEQPAHIVEAFNLIHNLKEEKRLQIERAATKYGKRGKR